MLFGVGGGLRGWDGAGEGAGISATAKDAEQEVLISSRFLPPEIGKPDQGLMLGRGLMALSEPKSV